MREYNPTETAKVNEYFQKAATYYKEKLLEIWLSGNQKDADAVRQRAIHELEEKRMELLRTGDGRFNPLFVAVSLMLADEG